jgi:hypothetical protein
MRIREPHETVDSKKEMVHREGVVDVDAILSPFVEPKIPTMVVEEAQAPKMTSMEIDSA